MNILSALKKITSFVFDIDGVLTDGTVLVLPNGVQARRMHIKDGFALQMALKNGYRVKVISGGHSPEVMDRLAKLGVTDVHMSVQDKGTLLQEWIKSEGLKKEEVLFMGDDLPDLPALLVAGLPACPADAADEVKKVSLYISHLNGGNACVRELIEKVLRINGHWEYRVDVTSR
jgi:3-deoxy-D-manno-octulosonate 8-phosphate phosphatase (KDO 8-P phosphatase)